LHDFLNKLIMIKIVKKVNDGKYFDTKKYMISSISMESKVSRNREL
jgi:hypothetical protein